MPVTQEKPGPYAPTSTILDVVDRFRTRGLPSPITADVLGRAGVSESLLARTLQALQTLDLIDKDGKPTQVFEGLRLAPEADYRARMEEWLRGAYAKIFEFAEPAKDDPTRVRDAFRGYAPIGQQERMVSLFLGLCTAAGMMPQKTKAPANAASRPPARPAPRPRVTSGDAARQTIARQYKDARQQQLHSGIPPALAGLLASLPADGEGWPADRRDKFVAAFSTVLDLCFPIIAADEMEQPEDLVG